MIQLNVENNQNIAQNERVVDSMHLPKPYKEDNNATADGEKEESESDDEKNETMKCSIKLKMFSEEQKAILESRFMQQYFITAEETQEVANTIKARKVQVTNWFSERR